MYFHNYYRIGMKTQSILKFLRMTPKHQVLHYLQVLMRIICIIIIGQFHNYVCDIQRTQLNNFPTKTGILMIIVCLYINATYK